MNSSSGSIFTQIIDGKAPGVIVYADERCVVLMDAYPMLSGHALVIPRAEHIRIRDLSADLRGYLFNVAAELTHIMAELDLSCGDANIVINDGKHSGQSVPHVHVHVVPRKPRDGFPFPALLTNLFSKLLRSQASIEELEEIAIQLRAPLQQALTENS